MVNINYKVVTTDNIDFLEGLCNQLMKFQADNSKTRADIMASMNYDNRLKLEYANTSRKHMVVAYDGERPVGFAFATIGSVTEENLNGKPDWASELKGIGFYPENYEVPKTIGTFKLLYVDEEYRDLSIGRQLSNMIMEWFNSHEDVDDLWVYVANGNEIVGKLYEKYGFRLSHSVFNGFIYAYYQKIK
ncbi:GNAT family N-acetyltransferase [Clostridium sp. PL3]|uniref:GNAT family N-acetyltransferase n=1 Tax=Clostridium thailandense TaxID=2794346 RepID=A0A949WVR0_9CLOT|nr:GNAT family N-acetyltransferase [Clostridium thailandense]MBV7273967.1 GNAT family N-acetyltransferase [Clostridium thailandense]